LLYRVAHIANFEEILGPQKRNVIVPVKCAIKNTQFGNVMCSREWNIERSGRWQRNLDCVTVARGNGTLVTHVLKAEKVELTDARADTIGYFTTLEKVAPGSMEGKADTPLTEENKSITHETV